MADGLTSTHARPTADEKFAEANSLRGDFENVAKNVVFTVRQLAYNVHGLRKYNQKIEKTK